MTKENFISKYLKTVIIGVSITIIGGIAFGVFTSFKNGPVEEAKQNSAIKNNTILSLTIMDKVDCDREANIEKNKNVNKYIGKINDLNRIDHKDIKDDMSEMKDEISDVKSIMAAFEAKLDLVLEMKRITSDTNVEIKDTLKNNIKLVNKNI